MTRIVVEHRGLPHTLSLSLPQTFLEAQGRQVEVVNLAEYDLAEHDKDDLITDLVAIVYSFTAWLNGQRRAKRNAAAMRGEVDSDAVC